MMNIDHLPIGKVKLNPDNPRQISNKDFQSLIKSLQDCPEMFEARPLLCSDRTGKLIVMGGNMRLRAAQKLGYTEVPVIILPGLTEAQEKEITIKDNGAWGEWDWDALANEWGDVPLADWGVDIPADWAADQVEPADAEPQIDKAAELNNKWKVKTGDLFCIGEHRLLCGDSTKREDVERVMGGERALVFSDAPYGVEIVSTHKAKGSIGFGGKLGFVGAGGIVAVNAYSPIVGDDTTKTAEKFYKLCLELGMKDFILWGGNYFTAFLSPSPCWLVWDKREGIPSNNFADCEIAWTSFSKPSRIYSHLWSGLLRKGNRKDEGERRMHPTQKPVGLHEKIMADFPADVYYDGFLGSGTTMVACQNLSRKCRGIEISPNYCAVILQRMSDAFPDIKIERVK